MVKKDRKWLFILLALLVILPLAGFYIGVGPVDIAPRARDLPDAVRAYRATGFPWEAKDLAPNPPVKDADNAAPLVEEAITASNDRVFQKDDPEISKAIAAGDFGRASTLLKLFQSSMHYASQATNKVGLDYHRDWDLGPALIFREFSYLKRFAKLFCYQAEVAAGEGKPANAVEDLSKALKLARFAGSEPTIISELVEVACQAMVCRSCTLCAAFLDRDPAALANLDEVLKAGWSEPSLAYAFKGEAYMGISLMRNLDLYGGLSGLRSMFQGDTGFQMPTINPRDLQRTGLPKGMIASAFLDRHLRYWTQVAQAAETEEDPSKLGEEMDKSSSQMQNTHTLSGLLDAFLMPVFSQAGMVIIRERADRETGEALIEALAIRAKTGRMPRTISEIPGAWVDPFINQPLKVKATNDSIRVYSLGPCKKDLGGKTQSETRPMSEDYNIAAVYPPMWPK